MHSKLEHKTYEDVLNLKNVKLFNYVFMTSYVSILNIVGYLFNYNYYFLVIIIII